MQAENTPEPDTLIVLTDAQREIVYSHADFLVTMAVDNILQCDSEDMSPVWHAWHKQPPEECQRIRRELLADIRFQLTFLVHDLKNL